MLSCLLTGTWHSSVASHSPEGRFFLYHIIVNGVVRYIGKGSGSRHLDHARKARRVNRLRTSGQSVKASRFINRLAKALKEGALVTEAVTCRFQTEEAALVAEREQIGMAPNGQLWNGNEGGAGCTSAAARKAAQRVEARAKRAAASRAMWADPGKRAELIQGLRAGHTEASYNQGSRKRWSDPGY